MPRHGRAAHSLVAMLAPILPACGRHGSAAAARQGPGSPVQHTPYHLFAARGPVGWARAGPRPVPCAAGPARMLRRAGRPSLLAGRCRQRQARRADRKARAARGRQAQPTERRRPIAGCGASQPGPVRPGPPPPARHDLVRHDCAAGPRQPPPPT